MLFTLRTIYAAERCLEEEPQQQHDLINQAKKTFSNEQTVNACPTAGAAVLQLATPDSCESYSTGSNHAVPHH